MSFAALLPFGLLLYKSGPIGMSMMYLAPIVTLWGLPMVATGTILWKRIANKELVASRTTGTALGILGCDDCSRGHGPGVAQSFEHRSGSFAQLCDLHGACRSRLKYRSLICSRRSVLRWLTSSRSTYLRAT